MSNPSKLKVGPLPAQSEDYTRYEETRILWGRVAFAGVLGVVALAAILSLLLGDEPAATNDPANVVSPAPMVKSATEVREVLAASARQRQEDVKAVTATIEASLKDPAEEKTDSNPTASDAPAPEQAPLVADGSKVPAAPALAEVISPVSIFHVGIAHAELAHVLQDGKPATPLGYNIEMSEQGIIKVILYTEMKGLQQRVLYHDWYRGDQRQARVRIPVNVAEQSSYSSKFINAQMLGDWSVKVVDEQGELYAQASFSVQ